MPKDVAIDFLGIGVVCFKQPFLRLPSEIKTNSCPTVLFARSSLSRNYTHTGTRTCIHDAGRQVAPLVLLSIHPSYHRTEHMCTRTHAHIDTDSEDRGGSDAGECNEEHRDRGNRAVKTLVTEENATEATAAETSSRPRGTHVRTRARLDCLL